MSHCLYRCPLCQRGLMMPNPVTVGELRRVLAEIPDHVPITIHRFTGPNMHPESFYLSHTVWANKHRCAISFDDRDAYKTSDPYESREG